MYSRGSDLMAPVMHEFMSTKNGGTNMRKHLLGTLIGLCLLGLVTPTWAVPMTTTLFGEVTEVLDPALALDLDVGTPATMTATWDTDDFVAPEGFEPGFFLIRMGVSPSASLTVTVGSHTWVAADDVDSNEFIPFLMFDAEGDFLGARFLGENSAGEFFGAFVFFFLFDLHQPPGIFVASSGLPPEFIGVVGEFDVPGWDGDFPVLSPVTEPGSLALLLAGLAGLGLSRRRKAD
jgi:hypothetical protein